MTPQILYLAQTSSFSFKLLCPMAYSLLPQQDKQCKHIMSKPIFCTFSPPLYLHRSKWMVPVTCCSSQKPWNPPGFLPLPHSCSYPLHDNSREYHPKYTSDLLPSSTLCHLPYKPLLCLERNSLKTSVPGCTSPYDAQHFLLEFKSGDFMLKYFYFHPILLHPTNSSILYP